MPATLDSRNVDYTDNLILKDGFKMPKIVNPDQLSLTTHHILMGHKQTDSILSAATGFIYQFQSDHYLITNWHNVTGRNPITGSCLSENLSVPDSICIHFRTKEQAADSFPEKFDLYRDDTMQEPAWYEHPKYGRKVDVVAIKIPRDIVSSYRLYPINHIPFESQYKELVADEAFVIGYPFGDLTYPQMPIWKKASIASEPDLDIDSLPKILIDTATRPGLSGSPVIMQRIGVHGKVNGQLTPKTTFGRIRNFLGVYSGRVGQDESKAQLGIVWKADVIKEIISAQKFGQT